MIENKRDDEVPVPPGREPELPVEEPPRPRRGPHEVPDPTPIDDPRPPKPARIVDRAGAPVTRLRGSFVGAERDRAA